MITRSNKLAALATRVAKAAETIETELETAAIDSVRNVIRSKATTRTGRYERAVTSNRMGDSSRIHDGGIIYGPWLEGTSSRNSSTSFKGHHQFYLATLEVQRKAKNIVRTEIKRAVRGA
jgi:hypothetical protein